MSGRRRFIVEAGGGVLIATGAVAVVDAPNVVAQPKIQWRMSTAPPRTLDLQHGTAQRLAKVVEEMSGGRFRIEVFADGEIMPAFECFDAASRGTAVLTPGADIFGAFERGVIDACEWVGPH